MFPINPNIAPIIWSWIRSGLKIVLLIAVIMASVFIVELNMPKSPVQQQTQTQSQSQSQVTNIVTMNMGAYGQPVQMSLSYNLAVYSGYSWEQERLIREAVGFVNALPDMLQQLGTRIVPVTYGFSCYVYVMIPTVHKL